MKVGRFNLQDMGLASGQMVVVSKKIETRDGLFATVFGQPTTNQEEANALLVKARSFGNSDAEIHVA